VKANHLKLYERIENFSFDDGAPEHSFVARLAQDNGWTDLYALRVLTEYRRFAFLVVVAGHMAVPSDEVDQAWHQHILFTRSWSEFCRDVLQQNVNHDPARVGGADGNRFKAGYEQTLRSYRRFFGEPPRDIWPKASIRFGKDLHFQRVNTKTHLLIRKAWLENAGIVLSALAAAALIIWMT
jgi:hypothetical protein